MLHLNVVSSNRGGSWEFNYSQIQSWETSQTVSEYTYKDKHILEKSSIAGIYRHVNKPTYAKVKFYQGKYRHKHMFRRESPYCERI